MDPRLTGRGDTASITLQLTFTFEPRLLEAVAAESRKKGCGLEDVILAMLRERFLG